MQRALLSALTGLRSNQLHLDVVGNNLANSNTNGFKSSRISFVDLLGQTLSPSAGPTSASGGRNPKQVGNGATVGAITQNMAQGSLLSTGRNLDIGIQGDGFFVLSDGNQDYYSRVGSFGLDASEHMVDLSSGYRVQNVLGRDIEIQLNTVIPAESTSEVRMEGNLPGIVEGPIMEVLETDRGFEDHQPASLTAESVEPYNLDGQDLIIRINEGAPETVSFNGTQFNGAAAQDIADEINNQLSTVEATVVAGSLVINTTDRGSTSSIFVSGDTNTNKAGQTLFPSSMGNTVTGTETTAISTTDLNMLSANNRPYSDGDQVTISGTLPDGSPVSGIFIYGDPATNANFDGTDVAAMVARINTIFQSGEDEGATAVFDPGPPEGTGDGTVRFTANSNGEANLLVSIQDNNSFNGVTGGSTNWSSHFFRTIVQGAGPDTASAVTTVFDPTGNAHSLTLNYERQEDGTWTLTPEVDEVEGTILSAPIEGIGFDQQGLLNQVPPSEIQVQWNSVPGTQTINIDQGTAGETDGVTQFGLDGALVGISNGYTAGTLNDVGVRGDGVIEGFFSNGQIQELDQLGMALFINPTGLNQAGGSMFKSSSNSGEAQVVAAQSGSAGSMVAGTLEASNVEIAEEFVHLIEAQRGFQANARMITTTDEVLAELMNLV